MGKTWCKRHEQFYEGSCRYCETPPTVDVEFDVEVSPLPNQTKMLRPLTEEDIRKFGPVFSKRLAADSEHPIRPDGLKHLELPNGMRVIPSPRLGPHDWLLIGRYIETGKPPVAVACPSSGEYVMPEKPRRSLGDEVRAHLRERQQQKEMVAFKVEDDPYQDSIAVTAYGPERYAMVHISNLVLLANGHDREYLRRAIKVEVDAAVFAALRKYPCAKESCAHVNYNDTRDYCNDCGATSSELQRK